MCVRDKIPKQTYYDILNLGKDCTAQDIKESYIKLTKKYHPDKNKNSEAHEKILLVNEAYSTLSKSDKRKKYDESLLKVPFSEEIKSGSRVRTVHMTYYDYVSMVNRNSAAQNFGKRDVFSRRKMTAMVFCCFLIVFGTALQVLSLRASRDEKSKKLGAILSNVKRRAKEKGREQALADLSALYELNVAKMKEEIELKRKKK